MSLSKKIIKRLFLLLNFFVVFIYLLNCLAPFLHADKYWFIAILGLGFPILFFVLIIFFAGWLIVRSGWMLLSLIAILLSWQQLAVAFSWHLQQPFTLTKAAGNLRVLQWNVSSWGQLNAEIKGSNGNRPMMFAEIKKYDADVLCFQEFLEAAKTDLFDPATKEMKKIGYPYYYYIPGNSKLEDNETGMVIFSKYPITHTGTFDFGEDESVQQLIYTDILINGQTIRVFTIHLQSVRFGREEYESLNQIRHRKKDGFKDSRTIVGKLKKGYKFRSQQADIVNDFVKKSPYPVILCGDFNDVPNSYTYFTIRGNLQDAFLEKGDGIGRTFRFISPTLRIDYIFADKKFTVNQYHRITVPYSDHYSIMADLGF